LGLFDKLRQGTEVFGPDNKSIGKIDRWDNDNIYIGGRSYARSSFDRFDNDRLYFSNEGYRSHQSAGTTGMQTEGEIRVPVMEERISVGKREVELGQVEIRKEVTSEQVSVPVDVMREEVHVERVDVTDRPIAAGDMPDAFKEGTIRVPVRGEEVVAQKQAFVTGEVVIDRERTTETQTISDTVRKERVDVDENFQRMRGDFQKHFEGRRSGVTGTQADTRRFEDAEPNYRTGFHAAHDERYAGKRFEDVEPDLRRQVTSSGTSSGTTGSGDDWEHLRHEIREGWERARS